MIVVENISNSVQHICLVLYMNDMYILHGCKDGKVYNRVAQSGQGDDKVLNMSIDVMCKGLPHIIAKYVCLPLIHPAHGTSHHAHHTFGTLTLQMGDNNAYITMKQARQLWEYLGQAMICHVYTLYLKLENELIKDILTDTFPNNKHNEVIRNAIISRYADKNEDDVQMISITEHPQATILFVDICDYTKMCAEDHMSTLSKLSSFYNSIDELVEQKKLQKIETIGDCCMIASGLKGEQDHALRIVEFGECLIDIAKAHHIKVRVGISTGPVVSGIMGKLRMRYFVFGDTVNTASRMESLSVPYGIKISSFTYHVLVTQDTTWKWEKIVHDVKGKGLMESYLLKSAKLTQDWQEDYANNRTTARVVKQDPNRD